jgi:hypothetical protein
MNDADLKAIEDKINQLFGICLALTTILKHMPAKPSYSKTAILLEIKNLNIPDTSFMGGPTSEAFRMVEFILGD